MTGEQFKKIRKQLRFNQVDLAVLMGLSRRTIQDAESSDQVKMIYQHSLFWIALRDHNMTFDENYDPVQKLAPDWMSDL